MNEIVKKNLLAGDSFMPEMHLSQPGFTYSACGTFAKNKERIQKFKETEDSRYIYQNQLDKACLQHYMARGDFKDLTRRTVSDKILHGKAFKVAKNPKYTEYQKVHSSGGVATLADKSAFKNENMFNKELAEKLPKPIIIRKVHSSFIDNVWGANLVDL